MVARAANRHKTLIKYASDMGAEAKGKQATEAKAQEEREAAQAWQLKDSNEMAAGEAKARQEAKANAQHFPEKMPRQGLPTKRRRKRMLQHECRKQPKPRLLLMLQPIAGQSSGQ